MTHASQKPVSAGGGTRTLKGSLPRDFESRAFADFATPARPAWAGSAPKITGIVGAYQPGGYWRPFGGPRISFSRTA